MAENEKKCVNLSLMDAIRTKNEQLSNRRTYNSGKISGIEKYDVNVKFEKADREITELGLKPVNPLSSWIPDNAPYWIHITADLLMLATCKTIYLQNDWEESRGARIEKKVAEKLGLRIITQNEYVNTREVNESETKKTAFLNAFLKNTKFIFKEGDSRIDKFMEIARSFGIKWKNGPQPDETSRYFPAYGRLFIWEDTETGSLYFAHGGSDKYYQESEKREVSLDTFFEVWNALNRL